MNRPLGEVVRHNLDYASNDCTYVQHVAHHDIQHDARHDIVRRVGCNLVQGSVGLKLLLFFISLLLSQMFAGLTFHHISIRFLFK